MAAPKVIFRLERIAPLVLKGRELRKTSVGEPIFMRYAWDGGQRDILVEKNSVDYHFLFNHPMSRENEENKERVKQGEFPIYTFFLVDAEEAQKRETTSIQTKAQATKEAFVVWEDAEMLEAVSAVCGYIENDVDLRKNIVYKTAQEDPERFLAIVNDPELTSRALVKMALRKGIIFNKGHYIEFNSLNIANNEAELVTFLTGKDDKAVNLAKGIRNLVDKKIKK